MSKLKTGLLSRAPALIKASANILLNKNIEETVDQLKSLKGLPQKAGQMLSMDISDFLPPEIKEKLSSLQSEATPLPYENIISILKSNLKEKFEDIETIAQEPIGAGSIGQVHRAKLRNGHEVVFKIRYPEIEKTIDADLNLLLPLSKTIKLLKPQTNDFDIIIKETKKLLLLEIDYKREKDFYIKFYHLVKNNPKYLVPIIYDDFCTNEIICMEYLDGVPLKSFLNSSQVRSEDKKIVLESILDLFITEFIDFKMMQTDPNFANYKVNSANQVILLDFGATLEFTDPFIDDYIKLLVASYNEDGRNILRYGENLGLIFKKDRAEALALFEDFLIDVFSNFKENNNPISFRDKNLTDRLMKKGWELWKKQRISNPHSDILFLHRKIGGLFSMLKESEITIDLSVYWPRILKRMNQN